MNKITKSGLKLATAASFLLFGSCSTDSPDETIFNNRGGHMPAPGDSARRVQINHRVNVAPIERQAPGPLLNDSIAGDIIIDNELPPVEDTFDVPPPIEPEYKAPEIQRITYTVKRNESLWSIANAHGITRHELARVNNLPANSGLKINQQLVLPAGARYIPKSQRRVTKSSSYSGKTQKYKVKRGDSISVIAWKFKTSQTALKNANGLKSNNIRIGQTLVIPNGNSARSLSSMNSGRGSSKPSSIYTIKKGDSLSVIAHRHGIKTSALMNANGLNSKSTLQVGKKLTIPAGGKTVAKSKPVKRRIVKPKTVTVIKKDETFEDDTDTGNTEDINTDTDTDTDDETFEEPVKDNGDIVAEPPVDELKDYKKIEALVVENDTLESLASDYNSTIELIKKANPKIKGNESLKAGIIIQIPRKK